MSVRWFIKDMNKTTEDFNIRSDVEWNLRTEPSTLISGEYGTLIFTAKIKSRQSSLRLSDHTPACCVWHSGPGSPEIWWGKVQNSDPTLEGYVRAFLTRKGQIFPLKVSVDDIGHTITIFANGDFLEGDRVKVIWGDKTGGSKGVITACHAMNYEFCTARSKGHSWPWGLDKKDRIQVKVTGGRVHKLIAVAPSIVEKGRPFLIRVNKLDGYCNLSTDLNSISIIEENNIESYEQIGHGLFKVTIDELGFDRIQVSDGSYDVYCNPFYVVRKQNNQIYFGDLHAHTRYSDGLWDAVSSLEYARDVALWDIGALADHDDGSHGADGPKGAFPKESWKKTKEAWISTQRLGKFMVLPSIEWSAGRTNNPNSEGDKNIYWYDPSEAHPIHVGTSKELWAELKNDEVVVVPHHIAYGSEKDTWWGYCSCEQADHNPNLQPLIEIYSCHGSSESINSPYPLSTQTRGHFVRDLLTKSWRVGFIASSDIHAGPCGSLYEKYLGGGLLKYRGGVAAIYAKSLTRRSIFDALARRQTYDSYVHRLQNKWLFHGKRD
jgi:hypothetical protein